MSSGLFIGLSALNVTQRLIDLTGQNIANANTPGYHRQTGDLAAKSYGLPIGAGVELRGIRRATDSLLDDAVTRNTIDLQNVTSQLTTLRQIQTVLAPGDGSLDTLLDRFFNQVDQLASHPDDQAQRRVVLGALSGVTNKINELQTNFAQLRQGLDSQVGQVVNQINTLTPQIADLNSQIQRATSQGLTVNDLLDQRDGLISQLSKYIDVRVINQDLGQKTVLAGGVPVVIGNQTTQLQFSVDANNHANITAAGSPQAPINVTGGQAAGLLSVRNNVLPDYQSRLNNLSQQLVLGLDEIHATGIGLTGPLTQASSYRPVSNTGVPLAQAQLGFPPQPGTLTVSVTNLATGQRVTRQLNIDPNTQSLQNLASAFSSIPNLQGVVNAQTNTLTVIAQPGYAFDFAGRLATQPDTVNVTGTAAPQISGNYTGTTNDNYTFGVVGSGTVGVTPNLTLQVKNGSGSVIASYNIGQGYSPGTNLPAINGVVAKIGAGTVNNNDNFTVKVTAQPDTANILTALGLNTLFVGDKASNLGVRPDLLANPQLLNGSTTGQAGDGSNFQRLSHLRDATLLNNGTQTFRQYYASLVGDVGTQTQQASQKQTAKQALGQQLTAQQQGIEGVDPNEELVLLTQYQRSFQTAAKYIGVINETLSDLVNIIK